MQSELSGLILLAIRVALVIALYSFLSWALLTLWREMKRQAELLASRQSPPITLLYRNGDESRPYRFTIPEISIGRDPTCDCQLDDKTVSANHARLSHHHGQWWIEDLGSTNGTFLNHEPVSTPLVITSGDELRFGQVVVTIAIGEGEAQVHSPLK